MLSYRKSQQVSLTEKLKKKNVIHVFGVSGSGTTMARFCLSAFVRVATLVVFAREPMIDLCHSAFVRVATQLFICKGCKLEPLPQRIRAGCDFSSLQNRISLSTLPQRIRAGCDAKHIHTDGKRNPLPQRIRAGCDWLKEYGTITAQLCHSAFVRVATVAPHSLSRLSIFATAHSCGLRPSRGALLNLILILCHSAFVRVATMNLMASLTDEIFATAHSCGLRHGWHVVTTYRASFATAHSCGLRLTTPSGCWTSPALPQRIRAGCDAKLSVRL